ncbi:hypothetical protein EG328_007358 [Venturia inaequalis]|uniref:Uncharacterized protein n=1 Tax=Venturia inaequalis TaxID=5025 RepID=A0A8H3VGQ3_VENIN|nr:hypothetical protein EG328_007358 [Venturia inaequalis]
MKSPSSATLLGLVGIAGLLPHNALALPADHHSTTFAVPAHHNDTTSTFLRDTVRQTIRKRDSVISLEKCMTEPGWWIGCCDHKTSSNLGEGDGDCSDYSNEYLDIPYIGNCEQKGRDHGPYCFFDTHERSDGARLAEDGEWGRYTEGSREILHDYRVFHKWNGTKSTGKAQCREQYEDDAKICNDKLMEKPLDKVTYVSCIKQAVAKCVD